MQKLAQGNGHCVNGVGGQVHGFYSLPKPSRHNTEFRDSAYDLPRSLAAHGHTKGSLTGSETDNEDVYTFKTPSSTLCREFGDLLVPNPFSSSTESSLFAASRQAPRYVWPKRLLFFSYVGGHCQTRSITPSVTQMVPSSTSPNRLVQGLALK